MPDFPVTPRPVFSPTSCVTCLSSGHALGFIDTGVDLPVYGQVYLCAGCAIQAGTRFGMLDVVAAAELEATLADARLRILELEQEVSRARGAGQWTWIPVSAELSDEIKGDPLYQAVCAAGGSPASDPTVCECGQPKGATSKHCRSCSARIASEARKAGARALADELLDEAKGAAA